MNNVPHTRERKYNILKETGPRWSLDDIYEAKIREYLYTAHREAATPLAKIPSGGNLIMTFSAENVKCK